MAIKIRDDPFEINGVKLRTWIINEIVPGPTPVAFTMATNPAAVAHRRLHRCTYICPRSCSSPISFRPDYYYVRYRKYSLTTRNFRRRILPRYRRPSRHRTRFFRSFPRYFYHFYRILLPCAVRRAVYIDINVYTIHTNTRSIILFVPRFSRPFYN